MIENKKKKKDLDKIPPLPMNPDGTIKDPLDDVKYKPSSNYEIKDPLDDVKQKRRY